MGISLLSSSQQETEQPFSLDLIVANDLEMNPALAYLGGLSTGSQRTMRQALDVLARIASNGNADHITFEWSALRFQHTSAIRARVAEQYAPATANKLLAALRGVLSAAFDLGLMTAEDFMRATRVKNVRGSTLPAGRDVSWGEITALMEACAADQSAAGVRDAAILGVLYSNPRRAEIASLDLADYDQSTNSLKVNGKGRKERIVPLTGGAIEAMDDWLTIRGDEPGPLFVQVRKGGHIKRGERLSTEAIYFILQERCKEAGVAPCSPHDFRRTYVGNLLDAGADIATVQKLMGHANVSTTARYDRRDEAAKRKAVKLLHLPYKRRILEGLK